MLYTVECNYTDKKTEQDWNDFYSTIKLPALISVSGFLTSQRFKALTSTSIKYLAVHTVQNEDVIISDEYKRKGGGNFAHWQTNITDWYRNLYDFRGAAPAVSTSQVLLLSPTPIIFEQIEILEKPLHMHAIGLDKHPNYRIAYVFSREQAEQITSIINVDLYEPITIQLKNNSNSQLQYEV